MVAAALAFIVTRGSLASGADTGRTLIGPQERGNSRASHAMRPAGKATMIGGTSAERARWHKKMPRHGSRQRQVGKLTRSVTHSLPGPGGEPRTLCHLSSRKRENPNG